jgi:hypothetical protein
MAYKRMQKCTAAGCENEAEDSWTVPEDSRLCMDHKRALPTWEGFLAAFGNEETPKH